MIKRFELSEEMMYLAWKGSILHDFLPNLQFGLVSFPRLLFMWPSHAIVGLLRFSQ